MKLKDYQESRKNFVCFGVTFQVALWTDNVPHPVYRMVCWSTRGSNDNGTNGMRWQPHYEIPYGFYAFISEKEIAKAAEVLAEESRAHSIQFILDDEMVKELGNGTHLFYKMKVLRSAVVV
jgi:hypothetical protein